jgi:hypothetical protein
LAPLILNLVLDGSEWSGSRFGRFTSGKSAPSTRLVEGGVGGRGHEAITNERNGRSANWE